MIKTSIRLKEDVQTLVQTEFIRRGARYGDKQAIINEALRAYLAPATEKETEQG